MLTVLIQVFGPVVLPVCGQTSKFKFSRLQYVFLAFITISLLSRVTDVDVFSEIVQRVLLFSKTLFLCSLAITIAGVLSHVCL